MSGSKLFGSNGQFLPWHFGQRSTVDFAGQPQWKCREEPDAFGNLVIGQSLTDKILQFEGRHVRSFSERDVGADRLANQWIGNPDDANLQNGRMLVERLLYLLRRNVAATANNDLFETGDEPSVAVGVLTDDVAGVKPPVANCGRSGFSIAPILFEVRRAPNHQFTGAVASEAAIDSRSPQCSELPLS